MSFFKLRMNSRAFIGATLFAAFLVMLVTSVLLFSQQHSNLIALIHTLIGFLMVGVLIWHLIKNYKPLAQYLNPAKKYMGKVSFTLPLALFVVGYLVASPFLGLAPAMEVYRLGQTLKAADKDTQDEEHTFIERHLATDNALGQTITVELKKGPYFLWPQYAIWLESLEGEFVQPLYVTSAIGTNNFVNKVSQKDASQVFTSHVMIGPDADPMNSLTGGEDPESKDSRMRPESLPVFLHQLGEKADNGYFVPTNETLVIDGFSGATMTENFIYHAQLPKTVSGKYRVRMELNHSFDFNEYYSSDRFPDDEIYSGDGFTAQPSVIYQAVVDFDSPEQIHKMTLVGRGHHSGRDGQVYKDTENLTTALELVDRILVSVN